jgi:diaminopimelate epimerase
MKLFKAHGLGNDYLVWPGGLLTPAQIQQLCNRNTGVGGDGVLVPIPAPEGFDAAVRIFNPDGSEAEKSGNGVRIFALWRFLKLGSEPDLRIWTKGGPVVCRIKQSSWPPVVEAEMGKAIVTPGEAPVLARVNLGNPHLVVMGIGEDWLEQGAKLEQSVEGRTNVQFVECTESGIRIRIWERGAGATLSSGSSACAAAAAAVEARLTCFPVQVEMQGGVVQVGKSGELLVLEGPIEPVCDIALEEKWLESRL